MKNRKLKIRSLTMNPVLFYFYEKYIRLLSKIKKIKIEKNIEKKWFSLNISSWKTFSLSWHEADYDEGKAHLNISILWFHLYIYTSQKYAVYNKETYDYHQGDREYGIKIHNNKFWFYNGLKHKSFEFPYTYRHIRHSVLKKDGSWEHDYSKLGRKVNRITDNYYEDRLMKDGSIKKDYNKSFWEEKWDKILYKQIFDYTYVLNNGTVQKRKATVKIEEREWRRYFLVWFKWKAKINKYIEIEFDKEVGERSGSWKGGVVGTSYQFLNDSETIEECFRRFEKNKKM
jgi:hypothetical protein